ncbi:MAG: glycosyltransferase [Methylococcaceae bacterium]
MPASQKDMNILYFTAEQWPTFRADILALFGKYLPRYGITTDLVTEHDLASSATEQIPWPGGQSILCHVPQNRAGQYVIKFLHNLKILVSINARHYDAIQVRDMTLTALFGLIVARLKGLPFIYWLSYPQSEGQIERAKKRGFKAGMRYWYPLMQGLFGKFLLYKIVLPRADHVFVQSQQMLLDLASVGIALSKMTPVPMGVDIEAADKAAINFAKDARIEGKRVVVYLGTLDPTRKIELLFKMLAIAKQEIPNLILLLVGDTEDPLHREWLKNEAKRLGVEDLVLWTGWLPSAEAWAYVKAAEVGLSPFPRGFLLDSASPTKAIEYMALGLPVIANDNPDQAQVIQESGGGICVAHNAEAFADALVKLLKAPGQCKKMGELGKAYVSQVRNYNNLASQLCSRYMQLLGAKP